MRRLLTWILIAVCTVAVAAPAASAAKRKHERRGGKVTQAWPHRKGAKPPSNPLAKWLARQVGPVKTKKTRGHRHLVATAAQSGTTTTTGVTFGSSLGVSLQLVRSFDIPTSDAGEAPIEIVA
jgi:hypothetical protein